MISQRTPPAADCFAKVERWCHKIHGMVIILMGVSGSGKTTVAARLAAALRWPFLEGDDLHPAANLAKMAAGQPLTDEDRRPWLAALRARIEATLAAGGDLVVTCSALKQSYRRTLQADPARVRFVYLRVDPAVIAERLAQRQGHFMKASMLPSQLAALEEPSPAEAMTVDATVGPDALVAQIEAALGLAA
jgi:gluconokinase